MPKLRVRTRYETVRIPKAIMDELIEICKLIELSIPQCLSMLIHETYLNVKGGEEALTTLSAEKLSSMLQTQEPEPEQQEKKKIIRPPP
jgi:hypothetical protein